MKVKPTKIKDCLVIECNYYPDERGFFQLVHSDLETGLLNCAQINMSQSKKGVIRGIHEAPYQKLVSCLQGKIFDVVVDLRKDSPTYLEWEGFWLLAEEPRQVLMPAGCGHGFYAEELSRAMYLQDDTYGPNKENTHHWKSFGIEWPFCEEYILSDRDKNAQMYQR
jgi:dTDP-4-dehydrorhamnose 3,5-epimerase